MVKSAYGEWVNKSDSVGPFWALLTPAGKSLATVYQDGSAVMYLTIEPEGTGHRDITESAPTVEEGMARVEHLLTEIAALRFGP